MDPAPAPAPAGPDTFLPETRPEEGRPDGNRQGKGPERRDEPGAFCPLARHEPGEALEAHDEADEPDPALSGAVPAAPHRTQLGPAAGVSPALPRAVAVPVSWGAGGAGMDESTLEQRPASPQRREPGPEEEEEEDEDEEYPQNEPKQPDGLGAAQPRRGVQRLGWISRSPSPALQDAAASSAFRPAQAKPPERRRAEPGFAEPGFAEWPPPQPDAAVGKQSWTVNAEDSVEPEPVPVPYACGALLEEPAKAEGPEEPDDGAGVFTCVECSIYFRRREHLLEHTLQHNRGAQRGADAAGPRRFRCAECGWAFGEPAALERHRRRHQEARERILEEIQKLNELPDEGREARLQCPKCVFGTNSSKAFVRHAEMHVKERKELGGAGGSAGPDGAGRGVPAEEPPAGGAPSACVLCGFPAPSPHVLREHLRFAHSQPSWQPGQPGTSRDGYGPARPAEPFGRTQQPPPPRDGPSLHRPALGSARPRPDGSDGAARKEHARKAAPRPQPNLGFAAFSSPKSHPAPQLPRRRAAVQQPEGHGGEEEMEPGSTDTDCAIAVPPAALELKRTFGAALRAAEAATEQQRQQLRCAVPVVLLHRARAARRPRGKPPRKKKKATATPEPAPEEPLPLDVLLLEAPLEAPLELEELLGAEGAVRNEERRCPYCPDRFHNGIGLANHVRGHLNRVGVSYNVRHFISAEQVKAIEQRFSFQKKKKKVANFDPGTFSLMRCEFCGAGFDTRAGLSSHARAHLRDFGITNWELTVSPIHILKELLATSSEHPALLRALAPPAGDPHRERHRDRDRDWDQHWDPLQDPHRDQHQDPQWDHRDQDWDHRDQDWDHQWDPHQDHQWDPHRDHQWDPHRDQDQDHQWDPHGDQDHQWDPHQDPHRDQDQQWDPHQDSHRDPHRDQDHQWDPHQDSHRDPHWDRHQDQDHPWDPHQDQDHQWDPHQDHQWDPHRDQDHQWDPHQDPHRDPHRDQDHQWDPHQDHQWDWDRDQLQDPHRDHWDPPWDPHRDPHWDPHRDHRKLPSPFSPGWAGDELLQPYRDVLAPDQDELVAMEVSSPPPIPKKSSGLEPPPPRLGGSKLSPEPPGGKAEPQDAKASSLTTCEVCGACFETRKGLSSHARSHLRQLGVAESESSGAPIDLLYELVRHKAKPEPALAKKSASPKEPGAPRPLLLLPKAEGALNKAIKSPPGFAKCLAPPPPSPGTAGTGTGTGTGRKGPAALPASPKGAEEKGGKLALSPLPAEASWASEEDGPLNLTSGSEPCRDIRCEFCGEFFENRKGLSSHARSHLRQMGVTEWYVNGSPIDTLREILARRRPAPPKALPKSLLGSLAPLEPRPGPELHLPPALAKKLPAPLSPPGTGTGTGSGTGSAAGSPPPNTARKVFPGLPPPSLHKKLKQDQLRVEIKRELMAGGGGGGGGGAGIHPGEAPAPPDPAWAAHEEMAPLNLSSRADPVRDIRCEFCGEFFENRKGLSSHARSHLRQMGVTEWSVNGSPIDTLREILRKKSKPCLIKKEPPGPEAPPGAAEAEEEADGAGGLPAAAKALPPALALAPLGGPRPGKAGAALGLAALGAKGAAAFLAPKRALGDDRLGHGDSKHKVLELGFKGRALHDKASAEACCELCGLYFENRKALASHARAHLRQFGVTEWCVNGSPIETLREWIRHRPHKAGAYRSYIQGGRPFAKKFRGAAPARPAPAPPPGPFLHRGGLAAEPAPGDRDRDRDRDRDGAERGLGTALGSVKVEEQRGNFSKFERRQPRALEPPLPGAVPAGAEFPRKLQEPRPAPRPVPALVPRPPQSSLVKFVGNIYTLKCRFCEVEFQGPLSIQEEWVRHLQRHILDMNFSKLEPCRSEAPPEPLAVAQAP